MPPRPRFGQRSKARELEEMFVDLSTGPSTPAGVTSHSGLADLTNDDHSQYVHLDSARTITAQHQFAPSSAQAPFSLGANAQGQVVTGLNADLLDGLHASEVGVTDAQFLVLATHANLSAERVFTPGDGLDGSDAGAGGAYTLAVDLAATSGLSFDSGALQLDDTVAGDGLSITNKILSVSVGDGLSIVGDQVVVDFGTTTEAIEPDDAMSAGVEVLLSRSDHVHAIATAAPITSLSTATTNQEGSASSFARSDHGHEVTSYADSTVGGQEGHLLNSDGSGDLKLHKLTLTDRLSAPLIVTETGQSLDIQPTQNLDLAPGSNLVRLESDVRIQSDNYASQTTGWGIGYDGAGDFRYLFADELHAKSFITDLEQALAGGQIIAKSVAVVAEDFTIPAAGAAGTLVVEDLPGASAVAVFQANDIVAMRQFSRSAGSLTIAFAYGVVTGYSDNGDGTQDWTFTRSSGADAGTASGTIEKGTLALDLGVSGNGYYEVSAVDGAWAQNSPYAQIVTWETHPQSGKTVRSRWGNLRGIFSVADEYGLYAGEGVTDSDRYLRISNEAIEGHNLPIELYDGSDLTVALEPGTNPYIAIGSPIPTGWLSQTGWWAGRHTDGTYRQYLGEVSGGELARGFSWDGSAFRIQGPILVGAESGIRINEALLYCPFDGNGTIGQDFSGNPASHLGEYPTVTGGVVYPRGKYGKGTQVSESTTNLILNPVAEAGGNFAATGSATVIRNAGSPVFFGTYNYKITGAGSGDGIQLTTSTLANANHYLTLYIWGNIPTDISAKLGPSDFVALTNLGSFDETWYVYGAVLPAAMVNGDTYIEIIQRSTQATSWYIGAAQLEQKGYPTSLCFGAMGDGHSWSGSAHASTSSRTAAGLTYSKVMPATWTVSVWLKPLTEPSLTTVFNRVWVWYGDSNNYVIVAYHPTNNYVYLQWSGNGTTTTIAHTDLDLGADYHIVATFDETDLTLYINNSEIGSATPTAMTVTPDTFYLGWNGSSAQINGTLDELLLLDSARDTTWVSQVYESNAPLIVGSSAFEFLLTEPDAGRVWGYSGGLFGETADGTASFALFNADYSGTWGGISNPGEGDGILGDNDTGSSCMWWDKSAGKLKFLGNGSSTVQVEVGTDGSLLAGDGAVKLNADGITIIGRGDAATSWLTDNTIKLMDGAGTEEIGLLYVNEYFADLWYKVVLEIPPDTSRNHYITIDANRNGSYTSYVELVSGTNYLQLYETSSDSYLLCSTDARFSGGLALGTLSYSAPDGTLAIKDGVSAPSAITGMAVIYVDTSDGDLKIKFADGTTKTIVVDS